jgi:hypothetical protein
MKFKLTDQTRELDGITLYRIQATSSFGDVKAGDLGGWVEKEQNLSKTGLAWISDDAAVYDDARILIDALVGDNAKVYDRAKVGRRAKITGDAKIYGDARVGDGAVVTDYAEVSGFAVVQGNACVMNHACVSGDIKLTDSVKVGGNAQLSGRFAIMGKPETGLHIDGNTLYLPFHVYNLPHVGGMCENGLHGAQPHTAVPSAGLPYWQEPSSPASETIHKEELNARPTIPDHLLKSLKDALQAVRDPRLGRTKYQLGSLLSLAFLAAMHGAWKTEKIVECSRRLRPEQACSLGLPPAANAMDVHGPGPGTYSGLRRLVDIDSVNLILKHWLHEHLDELPGLMAPDTPFMVETLEALTRMFRPASASSGKPKYRASARRKSVLNRKRATK